MLTDLCRRTDDTERQIFFLIFDGNRGASCVSLCVPWKYNGHVVFSLPVTLLLCLLSVGSDQTVESNELNERGAIKIGTAEFVTKVLSVSNVS